MKLIELVAAVKKRNPLAAKLTDAQLRAVVTATVKELSALVETATEAEPAKLLGFGQFRLKMIATKAKPDVPVRRLIFVPAKFKLGEKPTGKAK